ncbi:F-box/LRR-repeat protein 4 [Phtheirospermum japonicum]|uniref:F-box/LRR-repeat protein 4 n=1 Tax=Phtheirospermum japonicum TaxID=374723 RepID=A0A830C7K5_9LAMI|nr:F-box/LRR-repeat protein 4 [Phtheirospermum japonicum]
MERLLDELLALILDEIKDPDDRKSFSQVCKNWLRLEGLHRSSLRVLEPDLILNFLPRFPNLLKFQASTPIRNSLIHVVANTCPKIQVLNLNYKETCDFHFECAGEDDIDDEGLCDIAKGCRNLDTVLLRRRSRIGDLGVVTLLGLSRNLRNLDIGFCSRVSDEAIRSIGDLKHLEVLNLQGCFLITDCGLAFLGEGSLCDTLRKLNLAECDQITDKGLMNLKDMVHLEELNLSDCGPNVTDKAIEMAVAKLWSLKKLNLSWLINLTYKTIDALARGCSNLEVLDISGCETISPSTVCAFAGHGSLKELIWTDYDYGIAGEDLEYLVIGCSTLERIVLDKRFLIWIPTASQERISSQNCTLEWG